MKKFLKTTLILIVSIFLIVFVNGCYYVFYGQEKSVKKLEQGKDLNAYEIASIYSMHTACWMFGWVFTPTTAHLAFCSQFGIVPKENSLHIPENTKLIQIKTYLLENKIINQPYRITFDSYTDDTSLCLNGTTITLIDYISTDFGNTEPFIQGVYEINMYYDYKSDIVTVKNVKIAETLFDYLENKNILHPFKYKDTSTVEYGFNYKLTDSNG